MAKIFSVIVLFAFMALAFAAATAEEGKKQEQLETAEGRFYGGYGGYGYGGEFLLIVCSFNLTQYDQTVLN